MKKTITILSFSLFPIFSSVHAQSVLLSWDIPTTTNGATATTPTSVNSAANNSAVSASTITMGPGIVGSVNNSSSGWGSTSWGLTNSQTLDFCNTNNDWFYFAVTAKPGKVVTINGVGAITMYASASGPGNWALLSSTNPAFATTNTPANFITNAIFASGRTTGAAYTTDASAQFNAALNASNIVIQSGKTVYFRLVGYNGVGQNGTGRIIGTNTTDFTLLGSVADAPIQTFTWNGGSSGFWNYTDTNWLDGAGGSSAFLADNNASFIAGAVVSITNTGVSFGSLSNNVPAGQTTTLSGGSLSGSSVENAGAGDLVLQSTNSATTLVNSGAGTLSLTGPGTYTTVNLMAGKIQALADGVLSGSVNASGGSTLDVGTFSNTIGSLVVSESSIDGTGILKGSGFSFTLDQNDKTVAVSLQGIGGLAKTGSKILTLSGSNTFAGDITISGGTLATPGADRLPDTTTMVMSSNTILRLGGNETIKALSASSSASSSQVDLQGYVLTLNVTASNAYGGSIVGTGSLVKNGSSIQTLTNSSTFSGGTTLNNGYFRLQASGNLTTNSDGTVILSSSPFGVGTLTLAGGSIYSSSLSGGRNIYNNSDITGNFAFGDPTSASGKITVSKEVTGAYTRLLANSTFTANADTDWEQPILGSGFNLSKGGASKLTLLSTNSLSTLSVLAGVLDVRGSNSIGQINVAGGGAALAYGTSSAPFGAAPINLSNGAIFGQSAAIGSTLSARTIPNPINVLGDVFFGIGAVTGSGGYGSYLSGNVDLGGSNRTLTVANSAYLYGAVTNGGLNVMRNNTDLVSTKTLGLYGMNSYSGGTTVNGSVDYLANNPGLQLGNDRALGSGSLSLAGGGPLTVKAVSRADDIYNASRIIGNDISIANGVSGVFDAGTNNVTSLDGSLTGTVTNNMTLTGAISGQGSLVKTNNGNLTLTGPLSYAGGTTVADGNLVVVKTNLTATVSSITVGINFSNNVSAGTYPVLPGALNGTYSEATYNNLSQGQTASFNASTGSVTVTGNPASSGPSFADSYPGQSLTDLAPNGLSYLMNYALGGSSANGISTPVSSADGSTLSITAIVRINDPKCRIVGEATTSLTAWPTNSPINGVPTADQSGADSGVTQKQVFSVNRGPDLKKFLRLKAIYTP
jgi:autotransporter-associated beta strand protein